MTKWNREQALEYLNDRVYVEFLDSDDLEELLTDLMSSDHRPWCRNNLKEAFSSYASDCTCERTD